MNTHPAGQHEPGCYEFRLRGRLDQRWSTWFDGMTLTTRADSAGTQTILRGHVVDQAALHGLLARLRDIGLPLISITRVEPDTNDEQDIATDEDDR